MPLITNSTYCPPKFFFNGHIQTIYPSLFRKFDTSFYERERISTADDDFLDLDWSRQDHNKLAIISHGLEGNSYRSYMIGMSKTLNNHGWDVLAWNFRGCSGTINQKLRFYHSGATDDLDRVIEYAIKISIYKSIVLIGFSMGGNLSLVYLGQKGPNINTIIQKAVVFSVPCDLEGSAYQIAKPVNRIYLKRFLQMLHEKIKAKKAIFPDQVTDEEYSHIKTFKDFDDRYTAPIHGFNDAEDYWQQCSSKQFITQIKIPTLVVNAQNDPFLSPSCFPIEEAVKSKYVFLEMPKSGGHVGFIEFNKKKTYWSEKRATQFLGHDNS